MLSLKVPLSQLRVATALQFAIVFNIDQDKFEKVTMHHGLTNEMLGLAQFDIIEDDWKLDRRRVGGSPPTTTFIKPMAQQRKK